MALKAHALWGAELNASFYEGWEINTYHSNKYNTNLDAGHPGVSGNVVSCRFFFLPVKVFGSVY